MRQQYPGRLLRLIPQLYLHGLSEGVLRPGRYRDCRAEDAPVSASTMALMESKWNDELAQWRSRPFYG